jgi:MscS family membrane protein
VTSVLAGLGLGGLALALGAQKTLENVFGAFALAVDQPFREGDFVKVGDLMGTVESIGLRSTRVRTLERTVVTIPNGKLSELHLESFAPRDQIRLTTTLGLVYSTSAAQVQQVRDEVEKLLHAEQKVVSGTVLVRLAALGSSSLDLEVSAYFQVTDFNEFRVIRERVLLAMLRVVEKANTALAYPTSTVQVLQNR